MLKKKNEFNLVMDFNNVTDIDVRKKMIKIYSFCKVNSPLIRNIKKENVVLY